MADQINIWDWRTLTDIVNQIPPTPSWFNDTIFRPGKRQHTTRKVDADILFGTRKIAPFVARNGQAVVVKTASNKAAEIELPRIRMKTMRPAGDLLLDRAPGFPIYNPDASAISGGASQKMADALTHLRRLVDVRMEWMAVKAMMGGFTYVGDEFEFSVDYQVPAANKPQYLATESWDQVSSAKIIEQIMDWKRKLNRKGFVLNKIVMPYAQVVNFINNAQVQALFDKLHIIPGTVTIQDPDFMGGAAQLIARAMSIDFYQYDGVYVDENEVEQDILPADTVLAFASNADYRLHFGGIEDLDAMANVAQEFFSKSRVIWDPSEVEILVESAPLPVPWNPDALIVADVQN